MKATKALMSAGELLDIDVLDHVVLGRSGQYASLRERGLVPESPPPHRHHATTTGNAA